MNRKFVWFLAAAILVILIVGVSYLKVGFGQSPQCDQCRQNAVATMQQCVTNACTSVGGSSPAPGACRLPQNADGTLQHPQVDNFNNLQGQCVAQERNSLDLCNRTYGCRY
jgi:hypothetical protein